LKIARALFIAGYRIPHACLTLQFDKYLEHIDQTYIFTNVEIEYLDSVFQKYKIDTSNFIYVHDREMDARWPTMQNWVYEDDYRGTWLYQQALKLAGIEYCDADVTLIQDPDSFCIKPYKCLSDDNIPTLFILPNETHSPGYYYALDSLGITRQTPHCFVSEFMPVFKEDWLKAKHTLEQRNNCDAFDAIINAVPFEPAWHVERGLKWFSEYEFLGNWTMTQREVVMTEQRRFQYKSLDELGNLSLDYNCACDAIPRLEDSIQFDFDTKTIIDFELIFDKVKKFL
jgi:hypothetical protein